MKYLITYNESLRDKMTGVSDEDVKKSLMDKPFGVKLNRSIEYGYLDMIKQAIDEKWWDDPDGKKKKELLKDILTNALYYGQLNIIKYMVDDLKMRINNRKGKALKQACYNGYLDVVKYFIEEKRFDININNNEALRDAIRYNHPELIKYLLDKGSDTNDLKYAKKSAIMFEYDEVLKVLDEYSITIPQNEGLSDKMTPKSDKEIISKIPKDLTPEEELEFGATHNIIWLIKKSIDSGVDIHYKNDTALRIACESGSYDIVKYLLENGADVHVDTDASIYHASYRDYTDIVKLLIEHGANINATGGSPIEFAIRHENFELVKFLVEKGVNIKPEFDYYIDKSSDEIIKYLKK